jgi:transposase
MTTRKRYTKEFKLDAIRLVTEHGCSKAEAARSLGINANMLRRWVKEYEADEGQAFRGNGRLTPEQEELRRLRAENRQLKLEREILKKATAFFAKESD